MAEVRPFCGVRYNQLLVKDLSAVICPPYDIITPQIEHELYGRSEYNFIRLEHSWQSPQDTATDNRYTRAAAILEQWLKQRVLISESAPAIYLHDHHFIHRGREYRRRGIIVRVRLEEWDRMVVRPHEGTLAEPKSDRVSLLWTLQANTSPILALFSDQRGQVSSLLEAQEQSQPIISLNAAGERHDVRVITEPQAVSEIASSFAEKPLYIADGHHRYESALIYQRERRSYASSMSGDEALNFAMMTLVDFADPGLVILPPHRLLRGLSSAVLSGLLEKLKAFFDIEELPLTTPNIWQQVDELLAETGQVRIVLSGLRAGQLLVLKLRDSTAASQMIPYFHSQLYKSLDVSIVDHIILEEFLGLGSGQEEGRIAYDYDRQEAVNRVLDQEYQLAFILRPVKAEVIKAIADAGDRMPRKSTYFYPKLPSGLVFYRLV